MEFPTYLQYTVALTSLKAECINDANKTTILEFVKVGEDKKPLFDLEAIKNFDSYTGYKTIFVDPIFPTVDYPLLIEIANPKDSHKNVRFQAQVLYQNGDKKYTTYSNILSLNGND
jgi:hypothetical protein